jgi:hypothetical protein
VYLACLTALVEKYTLAESYWREASTISVFAIEQALVNLCDELQSRTDLIEGNTLVDAPFYQGRITWLVGLVSAFVLWERFRDPNWIIRDWFRTFVVSHQKDLFLWGEAAIPQFLVTFWFLRQIDATPAPDVLLAHLIQSICDVNEVEHSTGLADPYHGFSEVMAETLGIAEAPRSEDYKGQS